MAQKPKVRADQVLRSLSKRHEKDVFLTEVKTGPTWFAQPGELKRLDAIAVARSWSRPNIVAYEVKVSRSDFLADEKWPAYRDYCHRLYFACPSGLIEADELPNDIGLVWYKPETGGLYTRKKALYRDIELPWTMFYHLVISHTPDDREHPFFSNTREFLEAWTQDKEDRKRLGGRVASRMGKKISELEEENRKLSQDLEWRKSDAEKFQTIRNHLAQVHGIRGHYGDVTRMLREIDRLLTQKVPEGLLSQIETLALAAESLRGTIKQLRASAADHDGGDNVVP